MLFSYTSAPTENLPGAARLFLQSAQLVSRTEGMLLAPAALQAYLQGTHLDREVQSLILAVEDEESRERVDKEIIRRIVTGKVSGDVEAALRETVEVLGLHKDEMTIANIPLLLVAYADKDLASPPVVINIAGLKSLADAVRIVWSKTLVSPHTNDNIAVAVMRMPPATATADVTVEGDTFTVQAVQGWGRFVGTNEDYDTFTFSSKGLAITSKDIGIQKTMIARNPRTQEIVKTSPENGAAQAITDAAARELCVDMRKAGLRNAVFGMNEEKHWLLRVVSEYAAPDAAEDTAEELELVAEPEMVEASTVPEVVAEQDAYEPPSAVIAANELVEEMPEDTDVEPQEESEDIPEIVYEDVLEEPQLLEPEDDMEEPQVYEPKVPESTHEAPENHEVLEAHAPEEEDTMSADECYAQTRQLFAAATIQSFRTIELLLREAIGPGEQPDDFGQLVEYVATQRSVPHKSRILTLWEMKKQAAFEEPNADTAQFALETVERVVNEF